MKKLLGIGTIGGLVALFLFTGCSCKMNKHYPVPECKSIFSK